MRKVLSVAVAAGSVMTATAVAGATTRRDDAAVTKVRVRDLEVFQGAEA